jgi:hypothetical protein
VTANLPAGERFIRQSRVHGAVFLPAVFMLLLAGPALLLQHLTLDLSLSGLIPRLQVVPIWTGLWACLACLAASLEAGVRAVIRRRTVTFVVTERRLLVLRQAVGRESLEVPLSRVASVRVIETALGRLLGVGDVELRVPGAAPQVLAGVPRPRELARLILPDPPPGRKWPRGQ